MILRLMRLRFLHWLMDDEQLAGRWILVKALKRLYAVDFCGELGIRPRPWLSVLRDFSGLIKLISGPEKPRSLRTYKWVTNDRRRRQRLRIYRIPLPLTHFTVTEPSTSRGPGRRLGSNYRAADLPLHNEMRRLMETGHE